MPMSVAVTSTLRTSAGSSLGARPSVALQVRSSMGLARRGTRRVGAAQYRAFPRTTTLTPRSRATATWPKPWHRSSARGRRASHPRSEVVAEVCPLPRPGTACAVDGRRCRKVVVDRHGWPFGQCASRFGRSRTIQPWLVLPSHPRPTTRDESNVNSPVRSVAARSIQVSSDS